MTKTIEKIIVKNGCDKYCENMCVSHNIVISKQMLDIVFRGTYAECKAQTETLAGTHVGSFEHCFYSGEHAKANYTNKTGYLIKSDKKENIFCFIAQDNTEALLSYIIAEETVEEIIERDRKIFRSTVISRAIKKSAYKEQTKSP